MTATATDSTGTTSMFSVPTASPASVPLQMGNAHPCAPLAINIGLAIVLMGLNSRAWSLVLGISGLVFGLTGVFWLGVQIDWILFVGAAILVLAALLTRREMALPAAQT